MAKTTTTRKVEPGAGDEPRLLAEISGKLDQVIGVLAAQGKARDAQIEILMASGCDSVLIGAIVGMQPGAVRTYLSRKRKAAVGQSTAPTMFEGEGVVDGEG